MPKPLRWTCPTELSADEAAVAEMLHRVGKFYVFLREIRGQLFDDAFQEELAAIYRPPRGTAPVPPALLAMVMLLQAYDQVGDAAAVVTARLDQRWQLVLGCLGTRKAPFSQGVLVKFRARMIAHDLDRQLLERTVALAKRTGRFGWQTLQAALDSSPLRGAGRIEDTWNLIGRAVSAVITCAAKAVARPRAQVIAEAGLTLVDRSSLKAALDLDWDDSGAQAAALERLLTEVDRLEQWVAAQPPTVQTTPALQMALTALHAVLTQDLEPDPTGRRRILRGVAKGRQPSLGDPDMRHGRKSRNRPFTGYKRHVVKLVGPDLIIEAVVRPANEPEHTVLATLTTEVARHGALTDVWMDRAYLASPEVPALHARGIALHVKPWTAKNGDRFPKQAFAIRLTDGVVECPAHQTAPILRGRPTVQFAAATCRACPLRDACTTAVDGRSVSLHPQEALLQQLRATMQTSDGRAVLRRRTTVEHSLARLDQIQGSKARYKGIRKNTLDVRRCATVANLQSLARIQQAA